MFATNPEENNKIVQLHGNFSLLREEIKGLFEGIERSEWQVALALQKIRDQKLYSGEFRNFEEYCESDLVQWGGYRRVSQLIAATRVIQVLESSEFAGVVTRESQARPLVRLVKSPEKLLKVVKLAVDHKESEDSSLTAEDIRQAVQSSYPKKQKLNTTKEVKSPGTIVPQTKKITITGIDHPRFGDSALIECDAPNNRQQIVTFDDGEKLLVYNSDYSFPIGSPPIERTRTYTQQEYEESLAYIREENQREVLRLEQDIRIRIMAEMSEKEKSPQENEEIAAALKLYQESRDSNISLQQKILELEGLYVLKTENERLLERIGDLERSLEERSSQQWSDTFSASAVKVLNEKTIKAVEKVNLAFHLDKLKDEIPPDAKSQRQVIRSLGMATARLCQSHPQYIEAAAILLRCEGTIDNVCAALEQIKLLPVALASVTAVLEKVDCDWEKFTRAIAPYNSEPLKSDIWAELPKELKSKIEKLRAYQCPFKVGMRVSFGANQYTIVGFDDSGEVICSYVKGDRTRTLKASQLRAVEVHA